MHPSYTINAVFPPSLRERLGRAVPFAAALVALTVGCELQTGVTDPDGTVEATTLEVQPSSVTLAPDGTAQLEATPLDADGAAVSGYSISWSSGDGSVATVDADGTVTGRASGTTAITASARKDTHELSGPSGVTVEDGSGGGGSGSGSLISDVQPTAYEQDTLETGIAVYIDRDYTVDGVPSGYGGWHYVRPANDDKRATADSAVRFTLTDSATVALAYDERATQHPSWLDDWTATGDVLSTTNVDHDVFTRVFGPGTVVLGGNMSGGAEGAQTNYVVFSAPSGDGGAGDDSGAGDDGGGGDDEGSGSTGQIADLAVSPSSVVLAPGELQPFAATGLDADGNTVETSVTWSATGGSIDAEGVYTAGSTEGTFRVVAEDTSSVADTAEVVIQENSASGSAYPNEPSGFTRIFETDFSELPPDLGSGPVYASESDAVLAGAWNSDELVPPNGSSGEIIDVPEAFSAGRALRVTYPEGMGAGSGNGKIYAWGPEGSALTGQATAERIEDGGYELEEVYISYRVRMASGGNPGYWELNRSGSEPRMKNYGYVSVGSGSSPSTADLYLVGKSHNWENSDPACSSGTWGCGQVPDFYVHDVAQQSPLSPGERLGDPGVGTVHVDDDTTVIDVDQWHHVETYFRISSAPGAADAEIKVWVDGQLVYHVTDFKSRTSSPDNRGVFGLHLNPVISGGGGHTSKQWTDYIDWDHVYVSGVRLESY